MYSWRIPSRAVFCSGIMGKHLILPVGDALGAQKNSASVSFFPSFVRRCPGVKQETSARALQDETEQNCEGGRSGRHSRNA